MSNAIAIAIVRAAAAFLAAERFYVCKPMFDCSGVEIRSSRNGAKMGHRETEAAAHRAAIRFAIGELRLCRSLPGVARNVSRILTDGA